MQEKLITINKLTFEKLLNFFKNPITSLIFGVLVSYVFYIISEKNKMPSYYISKPNLVAQKSEKNLKILYNGVEYKNIYYRKLILWNEGKEYIDSENFIDSKPMKLYNTDSINFLSVNTLKTSREDLKIENKILNNNTIIFKIINNEAIEENDGVCFHILYSDNKNGKSNFKFSSRIKGTENGFKYRDLDNFKTYSSKKSIYTLWIILLSILAIRVISLLIFKKAIVFRKWEMVFVLCFFFLTIYETIYYIFYSTNLNWLN
jgi:hypothetical protein